MPESEAVTMSDRVRIEQMASAIMEGLTEYANLATDDMKKAVKKAADLTRKEIQAHAPKDTGAYAKSWVVKTVRESSNALEMVVHSRNRYQLTHLLEFGHAKRGGGRVPGRAHIALAEAKAAQVLEEEIERSLGSG